jgi:hypothetical protein
MADGEGRAAEQVDKWRNELVDLSRRNRLLNATGGRATTLRIVEPGVDEILAGLGLLEDENGANGNFWRFFVPPVEQDADDEDPFAGVSGDTSHEVSPQEDELVTNAVSGANLSRALRTLYRTSNAEFMDKGIRTLYLGFGLLRWCEAPEEWQQSPLVLVPVELERPSPREPFRLVATEDDVDVNPALRIKLQSDFDIALPEFTSLDDIALLFEQVTSRVRSQEGWQVTDEVLFGRFSFHKEAMYQDLLVNEEQILASLLVRALCGDQSNTEEFGFEFVPDEEIDKRIPPEDLSSILDADSTQRRCIAAARDGNSFVMDGPPGTGKSQTIANVIAELMANRRSVLFVSEKAAALEVVKTRLDHAGLGSYVLELHSHKATRKEVAQALGGALTELPRAAARVDSATVKRAQVQREALTSFAEAQNELRQPFNRSLHWAIGRFTQLKDAPRAPSPSLVEMELSQSDYEDILAHARRLATAWGPVTRGANFLWRDLKDPTELRARRSQIEVVLQQCIDSIQTCHEMFDVSADSLDLAEPRTWSDLQQQFSIVDCLTRRVPVPVDWLVVSDLSYLKEQTATWAERSATYLNQLNDLNERSQTWRSLDSSIGDKLRDDRRASADMSPPLRLEDNDDLKGLELLEQTLEWMLATTPMLVSLSKGLSAALGLSERTDLNSLKQVVELGRLGASANLPDRNWVSSRNLTAAKRALSRLEPLVDSYRATAEQLSVVFNPTVVQLDIESFYDGPTDLVPKIGRLSARGRANRKQLRACTLDGKASDQAVASLPLVRQFQRTVTDLREEESQSAGALGDAYYRSTETDMGALRDALELAERILSIISEDSPEDLSALGAALSKDSLTSRSIANQAEELGRVLDLFEQSLSVVRAPELAESTVNAIGVWSHSAKAYVEAIRKALATVQSSFPGVSEINESGAVFEAIESVLAAENEFERGQASLVAAFGDFYRGPSSDWEFVAEAIEWSDELRKKIGASISERHAECLLGEEIDFDGLESTFDTTAKSMREVVGWFEETHARTIESELHGQFQDATEFLTTLIGSSGDIEEWGEFAAGFEALARLGLADVVSHCVAHGADSQELPDICERAVLAGWIDRVLAEDPRCRPSQAEERDRLVAEFRELDGVLVSHAAAKVIDVANALRPSFPSGGFATIRHEAEKKRKHRPIRKLLEECGTAALSLKPCFMMSPLSVSQFLPSTLKFDAVIFDEASQVRPSDAINAVYRGVQLIVAGDNKQLPPTNFFERAIDAGEDVYDEEDLSEFESVLDLCRGSGILSTLPLQWHYRSRHEDLITYSNRAFYDSKLITYPSAKHSGEDVGLHFIHVEDGIYGRGTSQDNPIEARRVAERVLHHAEAHSELTLGVVAFSEAQSDRIEFEVERLRRDRPDLDDYFHESRLNGFFVKNLETVQGDERDIIIFSIGYGHDELGKFPMSFGPLNKPGGQRRLNVAITRARQRVEVVSSVTAADFTDSDNAGVLHLRRYLDYAANGLKALTPVTITNAEPESPFEREVFSTLRRWGHDVEAQVGHAGYRIDIGIRHPAQPGKWLLGVECDGAAYHSSATARDRDRLRQQVLEGLDWKLHRIWGPSWYHDRTGSEARLQRAIDRALTGDTRLSASSRTANPVDVVIESIDFDDAYVPEWVTPYDAVEIELEMRRPALEMSTAGRMMRDCVVQVVEHEGPVHPEVVVRRIRKRWNAENLRSRFRKAVDDAIRYLVRDKKIRYVEDSFLALASNPSYALVRVPVSGDPSTERAIDEVSRRELRSAMIYLLREGREIDRSELCVRVARIFGWSRTGARIIEQLDKQFEFLLEHGYILQDGAGVCRLTPTSEEIIDKRKRDG